MGNGGESKSEFALILFAGLIVFNLFTECFNRAPDLIVSNANYVRKVIFPLEILSVVSVVASLFHGFISLSVWLLAYTIQFGLPHKTTLILPLILAPLILSTLGISWVLASLGVYIRDTSQFTSMFSSVLMFLTPIFYPASALPEGFQKILFLNPLTPAVEATRDVLFWGTIPDFTGLAVYWLAAALIAWLGFAWFQKTRKGFADVL
jgi:lipopolysaccharide transport system permease protein